MHFPPQTYVNIGGQKQREACDKASKPEATKLGSGMMGSSTLTVL